MTGLDTWLKRATRAWRTTRPPRSAPKFNSITNRHMTLRLAPGPTADEADNAARAALGDAKAVNRQYRDVLPDVPRSASALRGQLGNTSRLLPPLAEMVGLGSARWRLSRPLPL